MINLKINNVFLALNTDVSYSLYIENRGRPITLRIAFGDTNDKRIIDFLIDLNLSYEEVLLVFNEVTRRLFLADQYINMKVTKQTELKIEFEN